MKTRIGSVLWVALILSNNNLLHSQMPDPLSFFPHHLGDTWEYVNAEPPSSYWQSRITTDSLGAQGTYYVYFTPGGWFRIDTTTSRVFRAGPGAQTGLVYYKLDANVGEFWTVSRETQYTLQARLVAMYSEPVLGVPTFIKEIDFVDSASQLQLYKKYLASGFGFIGQDIDAWPDFRIRGCIINGVQHGIVSVTDEEQSKPKVIALHQNYPNPFNPTTTIRFDLPVAGYVELSIYDVLGGEVRTFVTEGFAVGSHTVTWDGTNEKGGGVSSGVYFYRLTVRSSQGLLYTQTKKMLLLR